MLMLGTKFNNYDPEKRIREMIIHSESFYWESYAFAIALMNIIDRCTDVVINSLKKLNCQFYRAKFREATFIYAMMYLFDILQKAQLKGGDLNHTFEYIIRIYVNPNLKKWRAKDELKKEKISDKIMECIDKKDLGQPQWELLMDLFETVFISGFDPYIMHIKVFGSTVYETVDNYCVEIAKKGKLIYSSNECGEE